MTMKRLLAIILSLVMVIGIVPAFSLTAMAADSVTYLDSEGNTKTAAATLVTTADTNWSDGWYYIDGAITMSRIKVNGTVHLILKDNAVLTTTGITLETGNSLTIYAQSEEDAMGKINATAGEYAAAIGGTSYKLCGDLTVNGGHIVAVGGYSGAGIGGGYASYNDDGAAGCITINGGLVEATGGSYAAGIGGGSDDSDSGTIIINGGTVIATAGLYAAGIGAGEQGGANVTINGGVVTATGSSGCAGIGGADLARENIDITITGGVVTATGGSGGAGIGTGEDNYINPTITITGGVVTATGGNRAAGIGGGNDSSGGTIVISNGTIKATGGTYNKDGGAGIGGGFEGKGAAVTISGGNIKAVAGGDAEAIGAGAEGRAGTIQNADGESLVLYHIVLGGVTEPIGIKDIEGVENYNYTGVETIDGTLSIYVTEDEKPLSVTTADNEVYYATTDENGNLGKFIPVHEHRYTNVCDTECDVCDFERETAHEYVNGICQGCGNQPAELVKGIYQITNPGQLLWFKDLVNGGNTTADAKLVEDIDMDTITWTPVAGYQGTFDGNGKSITNWSMSAAGSNQGLFGSVNGGTIKNFTVYGNITIASNSTGVGVVGELLGNGNVSNINSYIDITMSDDMDESAAYIGGIVGKLTQGTVEESVYYGIIDNKTASVDQTGGIVGYVNYNSGDCVIKNCGFYGTIKTNYNGAPSVGGVLGYSRSSMLSLTNCLSVGEIVKGNNTTGDNITAFGTINGAPLNISDLYYLTGTADNATANSGSYSYNPPTGAVSAVTAEQLKEGGVTYLLNNGVTDGSQVWYQSIGKDEYPLFEGDTVYKVGYACDSGDDFTYSNADRAYKHKDENEDGICDICSEALLGYMNLYFDEESKTVVTEEKYVPDYVTVTADTVTMKNGWYFVEEDVTVDQRITVDGIVNIILGDGATLVAGEGLYTLKDSALAIYAQSTGDSAGVLVGSGDTFYAGIGGKESEILINGGIITATSGTFAPGIGGEGCTVTINGGAISTTGGNSGAGIGSDTLTINGGIITAEGGRYGAGICGGKSYDGGMVTINGGTITAVGNSAAGIGGSNGYDGGVVVINGGNVKATGYKGIGAGSYSHEDGTLTNGDGENVYLHTITLNGVNEQMSVTDIEGVENYGLNDVKTLDENVLYFYLPTSDSPTDVIVNENETFSGAMSGETDKSGTFYHESHSYTADCDTYCNVCNEEREVSADHIYTDRQDIDCNVCGTERNWKVLGTDNGDGTYSLPENVVGYYIDDTFVDAGKYAVSGGEVITTVYFNVTMVDGAQVRYSGGLDENGKVKTGNGLRFIATVDRSEFDAIGYGMKLTAEGSSLETVVTAEKWQDDTTFSVALTDMAESNYIRKFTATPFVTVKYDDGTEKTIYGTDTVTRSIYQVAAGLLKDETQSAYGLSDVLNAYANQTGIRLVVKDGELKANTNYTESGSYNLTEEELHFEVSGAEYDAAGNKYSVILTAIGNGEIITDNNYWYDYIRINNNNSLIKDKVTVERVEGNSKAVKVTFAADGLIERPSDSNDNTTPDNAGDGFDSETGF